MYMVPALQVGHARPLLFSCHYSDGQCVFQDEGQCNGNWSYDHSRQMCYQTARQSPFNESEGVCSRCGGGLLSFRAMSDWLSLKTLPLVHPAAMEDVNVTRFWLDLRLNSLNGKPHFNGTSFQPTLVELPIKDGTLRSYYTGEKSTDGWMCFIVVFRQKWASKGDTWKTIRCQGNRTRKAVLCQRPGN